MAAPRPRAPMPVGQNPVGGIVGGPGPVDKSLICPGLLVGRLIGPAGATIKKLSAETGAQINMDTVAQPGGGKAVVIAAADPAARERAKAAVQDWIKNNQGPSNVGIGGPAGMLQPPRPVG